MDINQILSSISLSTIAVAIWQTRVTLGLDKSSKRKEEISTTLDLCYKIFQNDIIPYYIELISFYDMHQLHFLEEIYIDEEKQILHKPIVEGEEVNLFFKNLMLLFNKMDSFASYFVMNSSIADEYMAYQMQGNAFCGIIERLKGGYILFLIKNKEDYVCLVKLYDIWIERKNKESLNI